ncbi:MAG TPA: oligosaccharide flippase family protein, partial [Vicinamibacterales bacterium]|nr:oligosaccharide flippase family protein [Vicinamibacterales bacterium]
ASDQQEKLQRILLQGTLLSLVMVVPIAVALVLLADRVVLAWVGPEMRGSVPVIRILAFAVAIRVGNATATTLLKGAGEHRMLAWTNLGTGVVNVLLSIALIKPYGLVGVAVGTLIPIACSSIFIVQPAAYRRVRLPMGAAFRQSVWPAIWPAFVVSGFLGLTRDLPSGTLLAVGLQAATAVLLYLVLVFGIAVSRKDRLYYFAKAMDLAGRRPLPTAA